MTINTLEGLKEYWRVMVVKHGTANPGAINKIGVILRNNLDPRDISYPGPSGHRTTEVFAFIPGVGGAATMTELVNQIRKKGTRKTSVHFRSHDRLTGARRHLETVAFQFIGTRELYPDW
jgi:hypothetical protein